MTSLVDFTLNANDEIITVGHDWDQFALENGAPELTGQQIMGQPLLDFVTGKVTRQFVLALLHLVRYQQQSIHLHYRCDSANIRRFMLMSVSPQDSGNVHFLHKLLGTEPRQRTVYIATAIQRGQNTTVRCSMCNLVKSKQAWVEPDQLQSGNSRQSSELLVIYGICETCATLLESYDTSQSISKRPDSKFLSSNQKNDTYVEPVE